MRLKEFTTQPKTPEQLRLVSLKNTKDQAAKNLAAERKRQQVVKAQAKLNDLRKPAPLQNSVPKL
jgi:uncharacterized protein with GYD domain